jgi:hypothetical protein
MSYLPQVIRARQIGEFIVSTRFDDGTEKYIDVSQWFKGRSLSLSRTQSFSKSSSSKEETRLAEWRRYSP